MHVSHFGRSPRLWLSVLSVSAALVLGPGPSSPSFAAQIEISALTPGLVSGFNDETIREFVEKNPYEGELRFGLSPLDRQVIVQLGLGAVEFRQAAAASGIEESVALTQSGRDILTTALDIEASGLPPALWRSFFQGSVIALGNSLAPVKRIGFYNPLVDGWLMTDWSERDGELVLTSAHPITGALLRGGGETELQLPAWTRRSDTSVIGALAETHGKTVKAFHAHHPVTSRQTPPPADFDTRHERRIIEVRLGAMLRSLNVLGRPGLLTATRQFMDSLYAGDAARLADLIEGNHTASVHWVNGLLTPLRTQFRPTGVLRQASDLTVVFGLPDNGRWLLLAQYKTKEAGQQPALVSVSFIDLVTAQERSAVE